MLKLVADLNADSTVHGILVQLPLPKHIDETKVLHAIRYEKDVDGFHPFNMGLLAQKSPDAIVSCTPKGCMELLKRYGVETSGKRAVVLGRSNIVGMPMSLLLTHANCTVTVCHSRTANLAQIAATADILVCAIGKPQMVTKEFIKPGAVVIDVGINSIPDATKKSGQRLVGDALWADVEAVASKATPVPGGVGPMTVATLMSNVMQCYKRLNKA